MLTNVKLSYPLVKIFHPLPNARFRLFCFPYAGAGASVFRTWHTYFPDDIEVYAIQLPGRESAIKQIPFTCLNNLSETLCQVLLPFLDLPFFFFGHSMGALVSFETARQLRRQNLPMPEHLLVGGRYAPQHKTLASPIHQLPDDEFIKAIQRYDCLNKEILDNPGIREVFLPILRADFCLLENYQYRAEAPLLCPISAFGGTYDQTTTRENLQAWDVQTRSKMTLHMFPGNHFFIQTLQKDFLQAVVGDIRTYLPLPRANSIK